MPQSQDHKVFRDGHLTGDTVSPVHPAIMLHVHADKNPYPSGPWNVEKICTYRRLLLLGGPHPRASSVELPSQARYNVWLRSHRDMIPMYIENVLLFWGSKYNTRQKDICSRGNVIRECLLLLLKSITFLREEVAFHYWHSNSSRGKSNTLNIGLRWSWPCTRTRDYHC